LKIKKKNPPRKFSVGLNYEITISDHGSILLKDNDQISFITEDDKEYDVVRKEWGFYATPSINGRLSNQGFKTALVKNSNGMLYIMLVEKNKLDEFKKYLENEKNFLIKWLDEV
tara:strand:- start:233 stop:574 length:342 start_codon:yes stop_codon:yes gene_type:complete